MVDARRNEGGSCGRASSTGGLVDSSSEKDSDTGFAYSTPYCLINSSLLSGLLDTTALTLVSIRCSIAASFGAKVTVHSTAS
jgi:hypothetical protein